MIEHSQQRLALGDKPAALEWKRYREYFCLKYLPGAIEPSPLPRPNRSAAELLAAD
jgi:hypothetical protein